MSTTDYRRGFDDGQASARAMADALKGADRTMYECIGGPKNGERIETGGGMYFRAFVAMDPLSIPLESYWHPYGLGQTIRTGEYRREQVRQPGNGGSTRTVYIWQGER